MLVSSRICGVEDCLKKGCKETGACQNAMRQMRFQEYDKALKAVIAAEIVRDASRMRHAQDVLTTAREKLVDQLLEK